MFKSKKLAVLAALLSLLMLVSLMAVPAFATEADSTEVTTEATTKEETTTAPDEEESTTAGSDKDSKEEGLSEDAIRGIINLAVGAVILIVLVVLAIKFRAKIPSWWKGLKSECVKITWCPKDKLKKNVFVVGVIILAIALAIGVLDFVFSRSMMLLGNLFH